MYLEVYPDIVFIINLLFDFLILRITGNIVKRKSTLFRCFFAAFAGSLLLCAVLLINSRILFKYQLMFMPACNFLTVFIAYYRKREKLYKIAEITAVFFTVSFLLGGVLSAVYEYTVIGYYIRTGINGEAAGLSASWQLACAGAFVCYLVLKISVFVMHKVKNYKSLYWQVTIYTDGKTKTITALADTGNHLKDPVSGKPVHVVEVDIISEILNGEFVDAVKSFYEYGAVKSGLYREGEGIRIIPFRAVGTPDEKFLVGIGVDRMKLKNSMTEYETEKPYVALYDGSLSGDGSYHMLLHGGEMMRRN